MSLVPADLVASYNGFTFNPARTATTRLSIKPVEDKAGRTVAYVEYVIGLRTWVHAFPTLGENGIEPATDTNAEMVELRKRLTKFGGPFTYTGRGLGDIQLNVGSGKEVLYGPKPLGLNLKYLGGKQSWQVDWEVMLRVPDCPPVPAGYAIGNAQPGSLGGGQPGGPGAGGAGGLNSIPGLELSFRVDFRIRPNGRTDRTVFGELRVPNNRRASGSRKPISSPDAHREKLVAPIPAGFRREWQPWQLSEDRTRLNFGWTDIELDGPAPPVGILGTPKVSHNVRSSSVGFAKWTATIRGEYEIAPGYDERFARRAFFAFCADRAINARQQSRIPVSVIYTGFEATEPDAYGSTKAEYTLTYLIVGGELRNIIPAAGLWRQVNGLAGGKWTEWSASLKDSAFDARGVADLTFTPGEDAILDLCGGADAELAKNPALPAPLDSAFGMPVPERSWVHYECGADVQTDSGISVLRPLPKAPEKPSPLSGGSANPIEPPPDGPDDGFTHEMRSDKLPEVRTVNPNWREEQAGNTGLALQQPQVTPAVDRNNVPQWQYGEGMQEPREVRLEREEKRRKDLEKAQKAKPDKGAFERLAGAAAGRAAGPGQPQPGGPPAPGGAGDKPDTIIIQRRTRPIVEVFLTGHAMRVGYPVPCPDLIDVEGQKPERANRLGREFFVCRVVRNWGGLPVYGAKWRLRYLLKKQPVGPVVPPNNPILGQ